MTAKVTRRPVPRHRARSSRRRRFSIADEENCYIDSPSEPNNVHLEAWVPGHLSAQRLRAAVAGVLAESPPVRVRRAGGTRWRARYAWESPPEADVDAVSVVGWRTDDELTRARATFLSVAPELTRCPPFRLLLARGPEWDSLILNAHHAAFVGRSCVRLLSLIADRYSGRPAGARVPGTVQPDARQPNARPLHSAVRAGAVRAGAVRAGHGAAGQARSVTAIRRAGLPARIAAQYDNRRQAAAPGYGLSLLEWPAVPSRPGGDASGQPVTVNDLLIAALAVAVAQWNSARQQPSRQVRISMPIDARGPGQRDEFGNLSRLATIMVNPGQPADPTNVVASQTRRAKEASDTLVNPLQAAVAVTPLPVPVKQSVSRLALRSLGRVTCDTTLLSNLGNLAEVPAFGDLVPTSVWFSTSAHMPRGLSVGAVSVGGRLHLCFRYRTALLDERAGNAFAAEFARALAALSPPPDPSVLDPSLEPSPLGSSPLGSSPLGSSPLGSSPRGSSPRADFAALPAVSPSADDTVGWWAEQPAGRTSR